MSWTASASAIAPSSNRRNMSYLWRRLTYPQKKNIRRTLISGDCLVTLFCTVFQRFFAGPAGNVGPQDASPATGPWAVSAISATPLPPRQAQERGDGSAVPGDRAASRGGRADRAADASPEDRS